MLTRTRDDLKDTHFLVLSFFSWFSSIFDEKINDPSSKIILDARTNTTFTSFEDYTDFILNTYGEGFPTLPYKNTVISLYDPFEINKNIIGNEFEKLNAENVKKHIEEILDLLIWGNDRDFHRGQES